MKKKFSEDKGQEAAYGGKVAEAGMRGGGKMRLQSGGHLSEPSSVRRTEPGCTLVYNQVLWEANSETESKVQDF